VMWLEFRRVLFRSPGDVQGRTAWGGAGGKFKGQTIWFQ